MNKKQDEDWEESIFFRCKCGEYAFVELSKISFIEGKPEYFLCFIEQPYGFLQRLKWLFKPDKYVREIILTKANIIELREKLKEE